MKTELRKSRFRAGTASLNRKQQWQCYLMLSTQILGFLIFTAYPICWAARFSWFFYDGSKASIRFTGFDNFIRIFTQDATYWKSWLTTFKFALLKLPIEIPLAMLLAVLLNKKRRLNGFFRAMYFLPNIISVSIVGLIFSNLFDYFGFVNAILTEFHLVAAPIDWFANPSTAMAVLVIGGVWNTFGINVLYFIAALSNVPEELYESAYLDGASRVTIFFRITLPLMAPVLQTILLLAINGTLHTNDYILVTTNGGPGGSTFTVMSYIVKKFIPGFADSSNATINVGYGCALAVLTSIIMAAIALGYSKLSAKMNDLY